MSNFIVGELIKFHVKDAKTVERGYATGGAGRTNDEMEIFQIIDIESYPSCSDFKGKTTLIKHGNYGLILRKIGRPWKIKEDPEYSYFDIYEVLTAKFTVRQVFKYNISKAFK